MTDLAQGASNAGKPLSVYHAVMALNKCMSAQGYITNLNPCAGKVTVSIKVDDTYTTLHSKPFIGNAVLSGYMAILSSGSIATAYVRDQSRKRSNESHLLRDFSSWAFASESAHFEVKTTYDLVTLGKNVTATTGTSSCYTYMARCK